VVPVVPPVDPPLVGSPVVVLGSDAADVEASVGSVVGSVVVDGSVPVVLGSVVVGVSVALVVSPVTGAAVVSASVDVGVVADASSVAPPVPALASYASVFGDMSSPS
jgi:hypothetical protein